MSLPKIVIVGRPNVGKSTLFNLLTRSRDALVIDFPGVTRDIKYGNGRISGYSYLVMDTSGVETKYCNNIINKTNKKVSSAILEGDIIYFLLDAAQGITPLDKSIGKNLHKSNKKVFAVINKSDIIQDDAEYLEFYSLGFGKPIAISSKTGRGIKHLLKSTFPEIDKCEDKVNFIEKKVENRIKIAVVGKPNAGKSTLINGILQKDRLVTSDIPGTTIDSIYTDYEYLQKKYSFIDTAGLYNKKNKNLIEKFSSIKTLESIKHSHIVVIVIDIVLGIKDYDLRLIGSAISIGKAVIILFNKLDLISSDYKKAFKHSIKRKLNFINYAEIHYVSAKSGKGIKELKSKISRIHSALEKKISTSYLNKGLIEAIKFHRPPLVKEKRVKIRYAHIGRNYPLVVIVHGKQVELLPEYYKSYISNYFRDFLNLVSIPVLIKFKNDQNPYT